MILSPWSEASWPHSAAVSTFLVLLFWSSGKHSNSVMWPWASYFSSLSLTFLCWPPPSLLPNSKPSTYNQTILLLQKRECWIEEKESDSWVLICKMDAWDPELFKWRKKFFWNAESSRGWRTQSLNFIAATARLGRRKYNDARTRFLKGWGWRRGEWCREESIAVSYWGGSLRRDSLALTPPPLQPTDMERLGPPGRFGSSKSGENLFFGL